MTRGLACAHFTGHLDGTAKPQQLFRQRSFAGVRVGDDGKRISSCREIMRNLYRQRALLYRGRSFHGEGALSPFRELQTMLKNE